MFRRVENLLGICILGHSRESKYIPNHLPLLIYVEYTFIYNGFIGCTFRYNGLSLKWTDNNSKNCSVPQRGI